MQERQRPRIIPARVVGHYALTRELGAGAVGHVWLAHDQLLGRQVALKLLRPDYCSDPQAVKGFLREAQATAKLNHPNTVTIYQIGKKDQQVFIAMEYVDGGSLADEVKARGAMPWKEATRAVRDAAAGLQAAHDARLIHRDVKPSNLMRARRGLVKVVDFGIAKSVQARSDVTQTSAGTLQGSPAYMSPEQCRGEVIDGRSDLYSLACTYYQLLSGELPFPADSITAAIYGHCHQPFPNRTLAGQVPESVTQILEKGSRKKAAERYQTADEFIADLEAALQSPESSGLPAAPAVKQTAIRSGGAAQAETRGKSAPPPTIDIISVLKGKGLMGKLAWGTFAVLLGCLVAVFVARRHLPPSGTAGDEAMVAGKAGESSSVPGSSAVAAAEATIHNVLRADYADHTASGRKALARKLLAQGSQTQDDRAVRYVCFRDARDLAAGVGDQQTAFAAIDALVAGYGLGAIEQKVAALTMILPQLSTPEANAGAIDAGLELVKQAVADDDIPAASRLTTALEQAAEKTGQVPLVSRMQARAREVADLRKEWNRRKTAEAVLRSNPDDAAANGTVGKYLCLVQGKWDKGLPLLAKSSDAGLKDLAAKEQNPPSDAESQLALADGWWNLGQSLDDPSKSQVQQHARTWYEKARPKLAGTELARANAHLPGSPSPMSAVTPQALRGVRTAAQEKEGELWAADIKDPVAEVSFSPDGQKLVSYAANQVRIWDVHSGKQLDQKTGVNGGWWTNDNRLFTSNFIIGSPRFGDDTVKGHCVPSFSNNGRWVGLIYSGPAFARVYDVNTQAELIRLDGQGTDFSVLKFSPDDRRIATGGKDNNNVVTVWDESSGRRLWQSTFHKDINPVRINTLLYSPDGRQLLSWAGKDDHRAAVYDADTGKVIRATDTGREIRAGWFGQTGPRVLSIDEGGGFYVWDAAAGKLVCKLVGHPGKSWHAAFSPDGTHIVTGGHEDHTVRVWDAQSGKELAKYGNFNSSIPAVAFSPDGRLIAAGSQDGTLHLIRLPGSASGTPAEGDAHSVSNDGPVGQVWSVDEGAPVDHVAFSPDGKKLAVDSGDGHILDALSGKELLHRGGTAQHWWTNDNRLYHDDSIVGGPHFRDETKTGPAFPSFSPRGSLLGLRYPAMPFARIYDLSTHAEVLRLDGQGIPINVIAFSPDDRRIATGGHDNNNVVSLWDRTSGQRLWQSSFHTDRKPIRIFGLIFSPDGRKLFSWAGKEDPRVALYDTDTGNVLHTTDTGGEVICGSYSPTGARVLVKDAASHLTVWDVEKGQLVSRLAGEVELRIVASFVVAAFSPDGTRLLAGGYTDGVVHLWDVSSGRELAHFHGHKKGVRAVDFSSDGQFAASGGEDGTACLWRLPPNGSGAK